MTEPIRMTFGGYGPPSTSFSHALRQIGERLDRAFPGRLDIRYVYNIMDLGYRGEDILWLVERGVLTLGYQSSSYMTDRVPELGLVDLPFLFLDTAAARAAMDGELGARLVAAIEARMDYRILGWLENGFRHISNRLKPIRAPGDMAGMSIRVLPSDVHKRTFELLGARPLRLDLTEAIAMVQAGTIDAQENPLANTVTYGVHKHHPFHTLSGHFYLSRPVFLHRPSHDAWPAEVQAEMAAAVAEAVGTQRGAAEREHDAARAAIEAQGCEIVELSPAERAAFRDAVTPMRAEARATHGDALVDLIERLAAG